MNTLIARCCALGLLTILIGSATPAFASVQRDECSTRMRELLIEEHERYRSVQYDAPAKSVLSANANTVDLIPYLTLNHHILGCRLRMTCSAVGASHGHLGSSTLLPHYPLGCSRLLAARGRWRSKELHDDRLVDVPIAECAYAEKSAVAAFSDVTVEEECHVLAAQLLLEEEAFLKLLVSSDSARRATNTMVRLLRRTLENVRSTFLLPLRGVVDAVGTLLHPIPCVLTQCT